MSLFFDLFAPRFDPILFTVCPKNCHSDLTKGFAPLFFSHYGKWERCIFKSKLTMKVQESSYLLIIFRTANSSSICHLHLHSAISDVAAEMSISTVSMDSHLLDLSSTTNACHLGSHQLEINFSPNVICHNTFLSQFLY